MVGELQVLTGTVVQPMVGSDEGCWWWQRLAVVMSVMGTRDSGDWQHV